VDVQVSTSGEVVERARGSRRGLRAALVDLEDAVSAAGDVDIWSTRVGQTLHKVRRALDHHVEATEADDGLLADAVQHEPRLAHRADVLRREHAELYGAVDDQLGRLPRLRSRAEMTAAQERLLQLLAAFSRHRHRGAELVYDAYATDISVGD
jgi:hypothetical protein